MRAAGLPDFRKLWGHIKQDLEGGYIVKIYSNNPVESIGVEKYVVFSHY